MNFPIVSTNFLPGDPGHGTSRRAKRKNRKRDPDCYNEVITKQTPPSQVDWGESETPAQNQNLPSEAEWTDEVKNTTPKYLQ